MTSSLFSGSVGKGLRHVYVEKTFTELNTTTGIADALLITTTSCAARLMYLFNSTALELGLWVVAPGLDPSDVANRYLWMKFPESYNLNYDLASVGLQIEPGTHIYVAKLGGTASAGKFRVIYWG